MTNLCQSVFYFIEGRRVHVVNNLSTCFEENIYLYLSLSVAVVVMMTPSDRTAICLSQVGHEHCHVC